jgi:iron complex transport system substrate-binding protein
MIEMAGGEYFLTESDGQENMRSTMNMQMEAFVDAAKDADILIYNSSIDGEVKDLDELLSKEELLGDFRAFRAGDVWCTCKNLFQETSHLADMILEMNRIFSGNADAGEPLKYFRRLT